MNQETNMTHSANDGTSSSAAINDYSLTLWKDAPIVPDAVLDCDYRSFKT